MSSITESSFVGTKTIFFSVWARHDVKNTWDGSITLLFKSRVVVQILIKEHEVGKHVGRIELFSIGKIAFFFHFHFFLPVLLIGRLQ